MIALCATATFAQEKKQKQWKDAAESELFDKIRTDANAASRLELVNKWAKDYPNTELSLERNLVYLVTYQQLNRPKDVMTAAQAILKEEPNNFRALSAIAAAIYQINPPQPADLDLAEKAASQLANASDTVFSKESQQSQPEFKDKDAEWNKLKGDTKNFGQMTLGYVLMAKKDLDRAETELVKAIQATPQNAQINYWLGNVIIAQKKPEKQSTALFHIARAASYEGPGALAPAGRQQVSDYFKKAYKSFHGSDEGIQQVLDLAKANSLPPADFKIRSTKDIAEEMMKKQQELAKSNPMLYLWRNIKNELTGANGAAYFEQNMKGAGLPGGVEVEGQKVTQFKGKLVSSAPEGKVKELILQIDPEGGSEGDVKLVLDGTVPGKMEPGTEISFEGIPSSYTSEPFMVVFDVERANLQGWKGAAAGPAKKAPVPKKAAPKKQ
jgi:hypothetical protein